MALSWNDLGLVEKVSLNDTDLVNYSYLADGTKVSAQNSDGDGLLYLGSLIYRKTGNSLQLESAGFAGGRFVARETEDDGKVMVPMLHVTDHLGSVRAVVDGVSGEVVETNDYYPFGSRWNTTAGLTDQTNRFRYNSKEEQFNLGTPYIDYGARQYDPVLGRWFAQDPLTEEYFSTSPYVFCIGNSLKYVDTNGLSITDTLQLAPAVIIAPQPYRSQDIIWDFIPMYSYAVDADIAFQNRRYGEWIKNVILGTADGLLFLAGSPLLKAGGKFIKPKALKHIRKAHWFNSGMKNKGKFLKGITEKQLQQMIDITMKNGKKSINMTPNGGFVYIYDFGQIIGTSRYGKSATRLKVVIDKNNELVTAFPL